jgi:hypothetical protein
MENIIRSHLAVKAALVVGEYRFNPSLLVEPQDDRVPQRDSDFHEILNEIWPTVQEANKVAPGFAKIPKTLILFAKPGKPFSRAGKGTVQRQMTVKSYASELDHLFSSQEMCFSMEWILCEWRWSLKEAALKACGVLLNTTAIDARLVYAAPSIDKMTESILALISKKMTFKLQTGLLACLHNRPWKNCWKNIRRTCLLGQGIYQQQMEQPPHQSLGPSSYGYYGFPRELPPSSFGVLARIQSRKNLLPQQVFKRQRQTAQGIRISRSPYFLVRRQRQPSPIPSRRLPPSQSRVESQSLCQTPRRSHHHHPRCLAS